MDLSQYSVVVYDMLGRQVLKSNLELDNTISVNNLSEGIYNLTIFDNNKIIANKKFVKK